MVGAVREGSLAAVRRIMHPVSASDLYCLAIVERPMNAEIIIFDEMQRTRDTRITVYLS